MKGIIYKITNKVNGKSYIGQTRFTLEFRWRQHIHKKDNTYFHNAIHKYGEDNFSKEILEECDYEVLNEKEIFYIAKYDTFKNGYNLTVGGEGNKHLDLDNKYDEIKELYLSGFSSNKIAELYGVDKATIIKILKSLDVKIRPSKKISINNIEFQELVEDYKSGFSLKQLAKRYDCSGPALKEYLIRKGVDIKVRYSILKDEESQDKLIQDYYDNKLKLSEIQRKYHCSFSVFKKILSLHGLEQKGQKYPLKLSDTQCLQVISLYNQGVSPSVISHKFDISRNTLYKILKRYHVNCTTV